MADRPLTSLMSDLFKFVKSFTSSFWTSDNDQGPNTEAKVAVPMEVDSEGLLEAVLDNPSQPPEHPHLEATSRRPEIVCKPSKCAHPDLQKYSEAYGRLQEQYKSVLHERNSLHTYIQTREDTVADQFRHIQSTVNTLQNRLSTTRAELIQARQDLQASRSFVSTEASDDGKTLVDMLSVLNQKIDDFAYVVGNLVPPQAGEASFTPPKTAKGLTDMRSLETLGLVAIETNLSTSDVLQYGIQHKICEYVLAEFFMNFAPGIDQSLSNNLNALHRSLCQHSLQAHSARWRAMTYSHIRPSSIDYSGVARRWVERILAFVNLCAPGYRPAQEALPMNLLEKAKEVATAALALQDKARIAYLAYDYEVFAVEVGSQFKDGEMDYGGDDRKKQKDRGEVVAVLGLGLKARRSVCGDEGQYVSEGVIPVRVSVLTSF